MTQEHPDGPPPSSLELERRAFRRRQSTRSVLIGAASTLVFGIAEGRRIVDNVQKGLVFLVSTHVALLGFIFIATVYGFDQPLLPIQILWLELFIDISAAVAFEREPPEPELMSREPRPVGRPLLTRGLLGRIAAAGGFSAGAALWLMVAMPGPAAHTRWLAYTVLVCAQAVRAYANRSLRVPVYRLERNGLHAGGSVGIELDERGADRLSGLLGRTVRPGRRRLELAELDAALRNSAAATSLPTAVAELTGTPMRDRRAERVSPWALFPYISRPARLCSHHSFALAPRDMNGSG